MRGVICFLTRIPVPCGRRRRGAGASIEGVAAKCYLFPVAAVLIALPLTIISILLFRLSGLLSASPAVASSFTLIALYLITGLMHLDGLADFFDGLMAGGSEERRIKAMKDERIGIAGVFATFIILMLNYNAIRGVAVHDSIYPAFIIAELGAKLSMNTCMLAGRRFRSGGDDGDDGDGDGYRESGMGMGAVFINSCTAGRYTIAFICSLILLVASLIFTPHQGRGFGLALGLSGLFIGIMVAIIIAWLGGLKFGMVSGDMMGAANEITRTSVLLIWAIFMVQ